MTSEAENMGYYKVAYENLNKDQIEILRQLFWGFQPTIYSEYRKIVQITRDFMKLDKVHGSNSDIHTKIFKELAEYGLMLKSERSIDERDEILECMKSCVNRLVSVEERLNQ